MVGPLALLLAASEENGSDGSDVLQWGTVEGVCAVLLLTICYHGVLKQLRDFRGGSAQKPEHHRR